MYTTPLKKELGKGSTETSLLEKKNLLQDNIQLKSPATSTSYPEEYKAALTPWIKKNIIHQQLALISTSIMHALYKVCMGSLLEYICSRKIINYQRIAEEELFFMSSL